MVIYTTTLSMNFFYNQRKNDDVWCPQARPSLRWAIVPFFSSSSIITFAQMWVMPLCWCVLLWWKYDNMWPSTSPPVWKLNGHFSYKWPAYLCSGTWNDNDINFYQIGLIKSRLALGRYSLHFRHEDMVWTFMSHREHNTAWLAFIMKTWLM